MKIQAIENDRSHDWAYAFDLSSERKSILVCAVLQGSKQSNLFLLACSPLYFSRQFSPTPV